MGDELMVITTCRACGESFRAEMQHVCNAKGNGKAIAKECRRCRRDAYASVAHDMKLILDGARTDRLVVQLMSNLMRDINACIAEIDDA